jgi:hypothetical protein
VRVSRAVTKSLCDLVDSSRFRHGPHTIVTSMDAVAVILGIVMFAILLLMIEGIDRV